MDNEFRLRERLEILLITYNRADYLRATLQMLVNSAFSECRLTVVDNCSDDSTGEVVSCFQTEFPRLIYLRNRVNISGNPNYLKAIELSSAEYTWILCDDDVLDFSDCDDVVAAVESDEFDLVEVGATDRGGWPRGAATSARRMVEQGLDYHFRLSFFPAFIFRTSQFDSHCFCWGYKHIDRLYPQFEFLNKSVRENFQVYVAAKRIVTRNDLNDHCFSPLVWYGSWVACCDSITDSKVRAGAVYDATADRGFFKSLVFWTILDRKVNKDGRFWFRVAEILHTQNWEQRLKYASILPLALLPIPLGFWVWLRSAIYRFMKVPENEVPPLVFVDRG